MDNVCGYKIKVIHQSYDEFLAQLTQADLILTPTRRLATRLNKDCAQWMAKKNKNVWHIDIVSITGWFDRLWQDYQDDNDNPPMQRLNAWQNQLIWQEIINAEPSPLLRKDAAAQMAEQAWILLKEWCIPWQSLVNENVSTDIQTFIDWCQQYQEACSKKNVLDSASVLEYLNPKLSHKIYLIGFTDIKPAVQRIFTLLCEQGSSIEILEYREKALVYCAAQLNAHTELEQAALWAKSKLAQNPNEPIGVIIPDLALRFNEVDRVFAKTLMPQTILANHYHSQKPYNISSGNRLSDYPVISIVFELFKYNLRKMPVDHLSKILLSPFITGGVSEHLNRSQIDLEIKKRGQEYVAPPTIVSIPPLNDSLLKPSLWVELFKIYLNAWGWPGERVLNSLEYQLVKRFYELLNDFASLDCIQKPLSYTAAHHLLFQQDVSRCCRRHGRGRGERLEREREPDQRPGQQLPVPLEHNLDHAERARAERAGAGVRRSPAAEEPHRPDGDHLRLPGRALCARAGERHGRAERALAGHLPEHELLRQRQGPRDGQSQRAAAVGGGRSHRGVRMARPPDPLDVAGGAARGQEQEQAHVHIQLAGPDRSRHAQGRDRRPAVLDARELQGLGGGDRAGRGDRVGRPVCSCSTCAAGARARAGAERADRPRRNPSDRRERRGDDVIDFPDMAPLACLMHWYVSMLYVVPVLAVGGWGWWSARRMSKRKDPPATRPA